MTNLVTGDVDGHLIQAGTVNGGVHFHSPGRPAITLPYRTASMPHRATAFQPRAAAGELARVLGHGDAPAPSSGPAALTGVVTGLGGVGKSQLVLDYAERAWAAGSVDLLIWVTAGSRDAIVSAYAQLAADLTGFTDSDPEHGARRLLAWLATARARWLIVLDDLQHPRDVEGLWPPPVPSGRVVVTTRRRDAALRGPHRRRIDVDVFTPDEAHAYLDDVLDDSPDLRDDLPALANALGHLPLALAQACAYMLDRGLSCTAYLARWNERHRQLATLFPESDWLPDEQRATVATTWSLSLEQANRLAPPGLARPLLEMAGLLDANGIPVDVFVVDAVTTLLATTSGGRVGPEQARDGLTCLHRLNLITHGTGLRFPTVRVHALVQRATRDALPPGELPTLARTAADALLRIWPDVERDTRLGQVLRANTAALADVSGSHLWTPGAHRLLFRAGYSLDDSGLVTEAREYFDRLCTTAHHHLGPDHPDTLAARHSLATLHGKAGNVAEAAAALEAVLADRLRILGPDHRQTLSTRYKLAHFRGEAGDLSAAATAFEQLLEDELRVLGPNHRHVLSTRYRLATLHGKAGNVAEAAAALEAVLADRLRVLGPDHPDTLATRRSLAGSQGKLGDLAAAATAFERLLEDELRVLGPDHPDTLTTRHSLAGLRGETGDAPTAVVELDKLLADRLRVLGAAHPDTVSTRDSLAYWRGRASS
ncbi:tetratricopeptide repeat protein [Amycolatopsis sp. NPDC059021]|uniref:tetratricopeptide repeat protein n=1 Tax=Amycolatopsis sp. NPDC059021 TaxID=3346704 RepID=UPI00366E69CC